MKARIFKSLLIIAFASALAGGASYILFNGKTMNPNNIISSGNLELL